MWVWIILAIVVVLALVAIALYNRFVRLRNRVDNAWAQIEVQLKRRWDLIPNLVESVKGYASHERETFEAVTNARAAAECAGGPVESGRRRGHLRHRRWVGCSLSPRPIRSSRRTRTSAVADRARKTETGSPRPARSTTTRC